MKRIKDSDRDYFLEMADRLAVEMIRRLPCNATIHDAMSTAHCAAEMAMLIFSTADSDKEVPRKTKQGRRSKA